MFFIRGVMLPLETALNNIIVLICAEQIGMSIAASLRLSGLLGCIALYKQSSVNSPHSQVSDVSPGTFLKGNRANCSEGPRRAGKSRH